MPNTKIKNKILKFSGEGGREGEGGKGGRERMGCG